MAIDHPFAGHALNAVDAKGRVSVPASFRNAIGHRVSALGGIPDEKGAGYLWIGPHPKGDRLLAYDQIGLNRVTEELRQSIADLPRREQHEAFQDLKREEIGMVVNVQFDGAGRMVLPPVLRKLGGLSDLAYFIGLDDHLEIWSPERAEALFAKQPTALAMLRSYLEAREA